MPAVEANNKIINLFKNKSWLFWLKILWPKQDFEIRILLKKSESLQTEGHHFRSKICKLSNV